MKQWLSFIILLFCTACAPTQIVFQNSLAENSEDADERKRIEKFEQFLVDGMKWECVYDKHANLKYKYGNRHFWAEGYYVSTVGLNEATIKKYIQEQEKHDIALDKLSVKEYEDPFKGC